MDIFRNEVHHHIIFKILNTVGIKKEIQSEEARKRKKSYSSACVHDIFKEGGVWIYNIFGFYK